MLRFWPNSKPCTKQLSSTTIKPVFCTLKSTISCHSRNRPPKQLEKEKRYAIIASAPFTLSRTRNKTIPTMFDSSYKLYAKYGGFQSRFKHSVAQATGSTQSALSNDIDRVENIETASNIQPDSLIPQISPEQAFDSIANNTPFVFQLTEALLETMHDGWTVFGINIPGAPWWLAIILATVILRSVTTLPVGIYQQRSTKKVIQLKPLITSWALSIQKFAQIEAANKKLTPFQASQLYKKQLRKKSNAIYLSHSCHPMFSMILPFVQMPLWVILSLSIRNMAGQSTFFAYAPISSYTSQTVQEMSQGGVLWFTDLVATDITLILPALVSSIYLISIEMNNYYLKKSNVQVPKSRKVLTNAFRGVSLLMFPIASQAPAALCLFWATSSLFSLLQNIVFHYNPIRKTLGFYIQEPSNEKENSKLG